LEGTRGLLDLGIKLAHRNAELSTGLQYPDTRDPERKVLFVSSVNEPVEDRVVEYPPPVTVLGRFCLHTLITCIQPGL
jgi:hypothetical protein